LNFPLDIVLAQLNPVVGNIAGNCARISEVASAHSSADLIVFSELIITGYPPEDLVLKPSFIDAVMLSVEALAAQHQDGPALLVSAPWRIEGKLYNAALLLAGGEIKEIRAKHVLPNYGVFDEKRIFEAGSLPEPIIYKDISLGVMSCEDMWDPAVAKHLKENGAEILIVLNASPFENGKTGERVKRARARFAETGLSVVYVNQVGGQDELVFDGGSFVIDDQGHVVGYLPSFEEKTMSLQDLIGQSMDHPDTPGDDGVLGDLYKALVTGLRDYVRKNGFPGVLLGLSGGIDSALSAVIAVDAIGAENVHCVMMPSRYTSQESLDDAEALADNLGVRLDSVPIEALVEGFHALLPKDGAPVMFENIQSRTRGLLLMAMSNDSGKMVLSTGNKSEMAVGYATLYGDMCGGFNALKDLYKGQVYALSRWLNRDGEIIPERIITRAPTAELRENQTDQDSLPEYDVLDDILQCLIEDEMSIAEIVARGYDEGEVKRVWLMLDRAEYKRRQAPPGVKVTKRSFGRDRRYPITNKFRP
jgi:NAD+ synthase